jgi:hypothetical protein
MGTWAENAKRIWGCNIEWTLEKVIINGPVLFFSTRRLLALGRGIIMWKLGSKAVL